MSYYQHGSDLEVVPGVGKESVQPQVHPVWMNTPESDKNPPPPSPASPPYRASRGTICGVSRKVFFVTTIIAAAIVVAAALAGSLGGALSSRKSTAPTSTPTGAAASTSLSASASASSSSSSTSAAPASSSSSSIYKSDCPTSNGQIYVSTMFSSGANGEVPSGAVNGFRFQKKCSTDIDDLQNLVETEVTSLNSCIDMCASYNFWNNVTTCNAVTYTYSGGCWIKYGSHKPSASSSTDSAVLVSE